MLEWEELKSLRWQDHSCAQIIAHLIPFALSADGHHAQIFVGSIVGERGLRERMVEG